MKKILAAILVLSITLCLVGCDLVGKFFGNADEVFDPEKAEKYERALALINEKEYEEAYAIFKELGDYKDSAMHLSRFHSIPVAGSEYEHVGYGGEKIFLFIEFNDINLPIKVVARDLKENIIGSISFFYNEQYNLVKKLDDSGDSITITEYEYDEKGILRKKNTKSSSSTYTNEYIYDERGNLIEYTYTTDLGERYFDKYTYDSNNNMIRHVYEGHNGYGNSESYEYDNDGNLIKEFYCSDLTGVPYTMNEYTYDSAGRLLMRSSFDLYGDPSTPHYTKKYIYDEFGKLVKMTYGNYGGSYVGIVEYSYSGSGNLYKIQGSETDNGELVEQDSYTYSYDNSNRMTKEVHEFNGITVSTRYSYDKFGNMCEIVTEDSGLQKKSSTWLNYQLMYFPFDMSDEEFYDRFIVDVLDIEIIIEYPDF